MKKFLVILMVFLPFSLNGQRFNGGLLAGVSACQVDGDSYAGFDKVGVQFGVFVNTEFKGNFGAQLEIKYTGKGARRNATDDDPTVYRLSLNYIDLPVIITYTLKEKYVFEAGLVPGYLFDKSGEISDGTNFSDLIQSFKKIDLAWLLGFKYKLNEHLAFNIRYSYSLFSVSNFEYGSSKYGMISNLFGYNKGEYNNYLTFGVYYQFY